MQRFEVRNQMRAVEYAVADIAGERGEPSAPEHAPGITHRVLAPHPGPIRQRGAGEHDRSRHVWADRTHDHDLPARLAVANQTRLAFGLRVQRLHPFHELRFGAANISDRLPWNRIWKEANEIAGMPGAKRHP